MDTFMAPGTYAYFTWRIANGRRVDNYCLDGVHFVDLCEDDDGNNPKTLYAGPCPREATVVVDATVKALTGYFD